MFPRRRRHPRAKKAANSETTVKVEDSSDWLEAVANYVRETQTNFLDLKDKELGIKEIQSVLHFLPDSAVTELNIEGNDLHSGMACLAPALINTKIKKFNFSAEDLTKDDFLQLLRVLKDTQITELHGGMSYQVLKFNSNEGQEFVSHLQKSKLTALTPNYFFRFFPPNCSRLHKFLNTSITCLDLAGKKLHAGDTIFLLESLGYSSIADLRLSYVSPEVLQELSRRLAETRVEKLHLSSSELTNDLLNYLVDGLVNSKVTDLDLQFNSFSNVEPIFIRLKETQLRTLGLRKSYGLRNEKLLYPNFLRCSSLVSLDLHRCELSDAAGKVLMENLRFSKLIKLNISRNSFGLLTVKKFAEHVKDINLVSLNISGNPLPIDAFFTLGQCAKESKLTRLNVSYIENLEAVHLLTFLKLIEGSSISQIKMKHYNSSVWDSIPLEEPKMLVNTTFSELMLCHSYIRHSVPNLTSLLKYSRITHLDLSYNGISDHGAEVLAEYLKETRIRRLNLSYNDITSQGAKALAVSLKDSNLLYLHLTKNRIKNDGLKFLAECLEGTFVTELDVSRNPGERVLLVDKELWKNKVSVHKFVNVFKQIAPLTNKDEFCFDRNPDDLDVSVFLETCMWFYSTIINNPRAVNVLLEERSGSFSRDEMLELVFEEFPRQFSRFVACRIETDVTEHVHILEKAEEMGLTVVVESLLLNRPVYILDEENNILHPRVYRLLIKYKQPVCNVAIEPRGVEKIVDYFTEHADVDGAEDLIDLLRNAVIS